MIKMNFSYEELQVLIQCITSLNYNGKDVIKVGLLADKIDREIRKIEELDQKNKKLTEENK